MFMDASFDVVDAYDITEINENVYSVSIHGHPFTYLMNEKNIVRARHRLGLLK